MAITGTEAALGEAIKTAIKAELQAQGFDTTDETAMKCYMGIGLGVAKAIVPHLVANIAVKTKGLADSNTDTLLADTLIE